MTASDDTASTDEPFNADGYWKAIFLQPDGQILRAVPLTAIVADEEPGPPRFLVWWNDAVMDCEDVPGFICALGSSEDLDTMYRNVLKIPDALNRLAHWTEVFEKRRNSPKT